MEDDRWIPEIFRDLSDEDMRGIIASYYTSTEYMDYCIGLIIDELEVLGLSENTLVIYIGDQGYLLGDHKRFEKHSMWDQAIKAPLVMRMGGRYGTGIRHDALVEFIDLAPTILDLLGVEAMETVQGQSLLPVIRGEMLEVKEYAFAEFLEDNKAMICDKRWKYVFTTGQRDLGQGYATGHGPSGVLHKLYDLDSDPEETTDLGKDRSYAGVLSDMQQQMLERFMDTHPDAATLPEGLTMEEKLIWFCEPRDIGIRSKMMGQVNLVRTGQHHINDNGSITLTTGILADDPVLHTSGAALVNGAIHGFVKAASQELQRGIRLNVVVPGLVADSASSIGYLLPGHNPVPMDKVVNAYVKSIEGGLTGQIYRVFE